MTKLFATGLLVVLSGFAFAQDAPAIERKIVEVKHLRGIRLEYAVQLLNGFMGTNPKLQDAGARTYGDLNTVLLRGSPTDVAAAEALLKRFDVPSGGESAASPSNFQFRIYLVEANQEAGHDGPVPPDIAGAVEQMKKSFQYKSYRLLDTVLLQGGRNGAAAEGMLASAGDLPHRTFYHARIQEVVPADQGKVLSLRNFRFNIRVPYRVGEGKDVQYGDTNVNSDLTIREGQKLVVGKLSKDAAATAVFLVITSQTL